MKKYFLLIAVCSLALSACAQQVPVAEENVNQSEAAETITEEGVVDSSRPDLEAAKEVQEAGKAFEIVDEPMPLPPGGVPTPTPTPTVTPESRDARRIADIKQIQTSLEMYYSDKNGYPVVVSPIILGGQGYTCLGAEGFSNLCSGVTYFRAIPNDPFGGHYTYVSADGKKYEMKFTLESGIKVLDYGKDCSATPDGMKCN